MEHMRPGALQRPRAALAAVLLADLAFPAAAQQPGAGDQDAAGVALVEAFRRFCMEAFPRTANLEQAAPGQVVTLPPAEVRRFLHDDPGRGWVYRADGGEYVVTVEDPPFHICAVRRTFGAVPGYRPSWLRVTDGWAAAAGRGPLLEGQKQSMRRDGMLIEGTTRTQPGPGGDVFLDITTTYNNGRIEQRLARRVMGR